MVALLCAGCAQRAEDPVQLMASAKQERDGGNHRAAIIHLKNLLQKVPQHAEARYVLGTIYLEAGDAAAAQSELRRAIDLGYERTKAIPELGRALLMAGEFQKVLDEVRQEGNPEAAQAELLTLRALAAIGLGQRQAGRRLLEQALAIKPDYADALLGQARLAASEERYEEATTLVGRALASAPENADAWLLKGDLSRSVNDSPGALVAYERALVVRPNHSAARVSLAFLHIDNGDHEQARRQVEQMRKLNPQSVMAGYLEALIAFSKRDYAAARGAVMQVLDRSPDHMPSVLLRGAVEFVQGSQGVAQLYLERVVNRVPDNVNARRLLIASLARSGKVQRALELIEPALRRYPQDNALIALAGEVYLLDNQFAEASRYFEKWATLDPKNARARTGLAVSLLASGETDSALAYLDAASRLDSTQYQADILLVMSHLRRANHDAALKAMVRLEAKQPDNPLTYNLKSAIYLGMNDVRSARTNLQHALKLQPLYVPAAMNLAQLDLQEKKPYEARHRLESILARDKDNVEALLALASLGPGILADREQQIAWLERAHRASPRSARPLLMLARMHAEAGSIASALAAAYRAQTISAENPEVLDALGSLQMLAGQKELALTTYRKSAALQPASPVALLRLADALAANGDHIAASAALEKALLLKPDYVEAQVALAQLRIRAGELKQASMIAQLLQKRSTTLVPGYVLEGDIQMAEKKFPQAARAYETAYGSAKSGALVIKMHGAYARAGQSAEADRRLVQWLQDSPDDALVRMYAAEVAMTAGDYPKAIEHYERLVQRHPDNAVALNNLAVTYQQTQDQRALETAERAYKLRPDNADIIDTLAWILVERGNTTRGLELLQRAAAVANANHQSHYHLALVWLKLGNTTKARAELEQLLLANNAFPQRAEALKLLEQLRDPRSVPQRQ